MRVRNISKKVLYYVIIHRKHIGKTIVVHNLHDFELMTTCDAPPPPHDAGVAMASYSEILSAMPSVTIQYIGRNRRPS